MKRILVILISSIGLLCLVVVYLCQNENMEKKGKKQGDHKEPNYELKVTNGSIGRELTPHERMRSDRTKKTIIEAGYNADKLIVIETNKHDVSTKND